MFGRKSEQKTDLHTGAKRHDIRALCLWRDLPISLPHSTRVTRTGGIVSGVRSNLPF